MSSVHSASIGCVERVSAVGLSELHFFERYAEKNRPVVLVDLVQEWEAFRTWRDANGVPDYDHLANFFVGEDVPVTDCGAASGAGYGSGTVLQMRAEEFFQWAAGRAGLKRGGDDGRCLYLKDWHMQRNFPGLYDPPAYLAAPLHDWLNLHLDHVGEGDDFRFCYVGVAGTFTPLHHDVMLSFSWSANICGYKRWVFFPPEATQLLLDSHGEPPPSAAPDRRPDGWEAKYKDLDSAWASRVEFIQEPGELVFVPSGWYHEVQNLTDAISINHNWFNAANLLRVWGFVESEHLAVRRAIWDLRDTFDSAEDWEMKCEELMKVNSGMNLRTWLQLLRTAATEVSRCISAPASEDRRRVALRSLKTLRSAADAVKQVYLATALPRHICEFEQLYTTLDELTQGEAAAE